MQWLTPSSGTTIIGAVFVMAYVLVAQGCVANLPQADARQRPLNEPKRADIATAPDIVPGVPIVHAPHTNHGPKETLPAWVALGTFTFDYDKWSIGAADRHKAAEISEFIGRHPALRLAVDGSVNSRGIDPHNSGLRDRRVEVVRDALIAAGVSPFMIETGAFGTERALGDRSIEVLVRTAP
jgi:outer membrane protein OmpA-like peptidoglycan-associated protein